MTESEKRVKAISLYDNWCETDTEDTLEIYCYEQGRADANEKFFNFDAVIEIEKKKAYNQGRADAINSIIQSEKNRYYCTIDKCRASKHCSDCRVEYLEQLKGGKQ